MQAKFLIPIAYFLTLTNCLSPDEFKISLQILKHLNIRQCILSSDITNENLFKWAKNLTASGIFTTYKNNEKLINYITSDQWLKFKSDGGASLYLRRTAIVWEIDTYSLGYYLSESIPYFTMPDFDWIIILKPGERINPDTFIKLAIIIPIDCQFLIIYRKDEKNYDILELYNFRKFGKLSIKRFGYWNIENGLQATEDYIFWRRCDLQGLILFLYTYGNYVSNVNLNWLKFSEFE